MHGGGGGTSSEEFREILAGKVEKDLKSHYTGGFPDGMWWPEPVPNAAKPVQIKSTDKNRCFAYTFCWHGEPEFPIFHRPLTAEFERLLQDYDPKYDNLPHDSPQRHQGPEALGCPYWSWEGWDGLTLPQLVTNEQYLLKTDTWKDHGFPIGSSFNNPYRRWFAPVSIKDQVGETFPAVMTNANTTSRSVAFDDPAAEFSHPWPLVSVDGANPSMEDVVHQAISNYKYCDFATTKSSGTWSFENAHNKFHNHVGGNTMGGIQGPGLQYSYGFPTETPGEVANFTGTMAQNQSIFDPLFWLHHGNVDRQLVSWQRLWWPNGKPMHQTSQPGQETWKRVLYPWTKPELLFKKGQLSWNTPSHSASDATFGDWWDHESLPYKYDEYVVPIHSEFVAKEEGGNFFKGILRLSHKIPGATEHMPIRLTVAIDARNYRGGEYSLFFGDKLVGTVGILSAQGSVCAHCASRTEAKLVFEASGTFKSIEDVEAAKKVTSGDQLRFYHDGIHLEVLSIVATHWDQEWCAHDKDEKPEASGARKSKRTRLN
jgi:hypothetical protein